MIFRRALILRVDVVLLADGGRAAVIAIEVAVAIGAPTPYGVYANQQGWGG